MSHEIQRRDTPEPDTNGNVFYLQPINLPGFTLSARGARPISGRRPTIDQWSSALSFVSSAHEASPYWLADLLAYAETRDDWREVLSQAMTVCSIQEQTAHNLRFVGRHVGSKARAIAKTIGHSAEVARYPEEEQIEYLEKATEHGWTVRELRQYIKAEKRTKVIEGQAVLEGLFRVILADPPWIYGDRPPSGSGALEHYPGMTIQEIAALPIAAHAMKDCALLMWTTAPIILQNPGPREVAETWGFEYKQQIIWDKVRHNFGHYTQGNHEILTIWTRGSCLPDISSELPDSVQTVRKSDEHSEKPEEFRRLIERMWTRGPYLELFGRKNVEGWTVYGNDARLWTNAEAVAV